MMLRPITTVLIALSFLTPLAVATPTEDIVVEIVQNFTKDSTVRVLCPSASHAEAHATAYNSRGTAEAFASTTQERVHDVGNWYADAEANGGTGAQAEAHAGGMVARCAWAA